MTDKTYIPAHEEPPMSQIAATLETLACTIAARAQAGTQVDTRAGVQADAQADARPQSYTYRLLKDETLVLDKLREEALEVAEAAVAGDIDHLRYEVGDVLYHLLVLLEQRGISLDELAAELNERMRDEERPTGAIRLYKEYVNRGK